MVNRNPMRRAPDRTETRQMAPYKMFSCLILIRRHLFLQIISQILMD